MSQTRQTRHDATEPSTDRETITLANTHVELERGPAGVIARIHRRHGRTEHAGPLSDATIAALREVGR